MTTGERLAINFAEKIGIPLEDWPGNCYAIACKIVETGLIEGSSKAVYGHWRGDIRPASMFYSTYSRVGFVRHGWIRMATGMIIDPTRWVFEVKAPYIWAGMQGDEYDEGGNQLRQAMENPPPEYDPQARTVDLDWTGLECFTEEIYNLLGYTPEIQLNHLFWLANLSLYTLGDLAVPVYELLVQNNFEALIPLDNRRTILGDT